MVYPKLYKFVLAALLLGIAAAGQAQAASEYHVKAAILYNLARMVEWPNADLSTANLPFPICFLGDEPFGDALEFIRDKKLQNRPLEFRKGIAVAQADKCSMLYISASEDARLTEILKQVGTLPLLTVSDNEGFAQRGVIVNLIREEKKVRMEINLKAADRAKLTLSPALLKLAESVEDNFVP